MKVFKIMENLPKSKVFKGIENLPKGTANDKIIKGCIVLEGGAFRGVYTSGVLDFLMEQGINMEATIGVSAGALNGMNYVAGQIGRSARINLIYRHDSRWVGVKALINSKSITGFNFVFSDVCKDLPFDEKRFNDPNRCFIAVATNCLTGKSSYFEKGKCADIYQAVRASASMPIVSSMVYIDDIPYLDGGCNGNNFPFEWAIENGYEKIIVVRTREREFMSSSGKEMNLINRFYRHYPQLLSVYQNSNVKYNELAKLENKLEKEGKLFVIAPKTPVLVKRLEGNMDKLGALYYEGYNDAKESFSSLMEYLEK